MNRTTALYLAAAFVAGMLVATVAIVAYVNVAFDPMVGM